MSRLFELAEAVRVRLALKPAAALALVQQAIPVLVLDNVSENDDLIGSIGRSAHGANQIGPIAGQNSHCQLFNPIGSGILTAITLIIPNVGAGGIGSIVGGPHDTALTTLNAVNSDWADRREQGSPVTEVRSQTNAGNLMTTFTQFLRILSDTNAAFKPPNQIILEEGQGYVINSGVQNITFAVSWFWREIPLA